MGIPVGIDVRDPWVDPRVLDRAFAWLRWVDATFSTYRPDSAISRLNAGTLALRDAAPEVRDVLDRCEDLRARTRGCFDVRARGALDPSAFVKGWAIEAVAAMLGAAGARNLCVHAGGDVCVRGERTPGQPWRVGIQHPWQRDRVAAVLLHARPGGRHLGRLRARPAHRGPAHGPGTAGRRVGHGPRPRSRHRRRLRHRGLRHGRRRARVDGRARRLRRADASWPTAACSRTPGVDALR